MTIKLRFALLMSLMLGGFAAALLSLQALETREADARLAADRETRAQLLDHWIDATSRALPQLAADLAHSEELAARLRQPDHAAVRPQLATVLAEGGASDLWLLRADGRPTLHVTASGDDHVASVPLAPAEFVDLVSETPSPRFFAEMDHALLEVCVRRLQASQAPDAAGHHWVVVARRWDDAQLRALASLTESRVSLVRPHAVATPPADDSIIQLVRPLLDSQGRPVRILRLDYQAPALDRTARAQAVQSRFFIVFGLLLLAALGLALYRWVLQPLRQIGDSLASQNPSLVRDLSREKSELGRLAELVLTSFSQRTALEREVSERRQIQQALERSEATLRENLAERARLGRDLHDGVIQSLYAAGMGLAGIRMQLHPEQTEAATRLEQTRAALNETIHDVRNFIIGLEPEALKLQTFSQAVTALLEVIRGMRPFHSTVDVDESLAAHLTLAQRVHALQIAREAVSNALRHGEATHIHVALRYRGEFAEFEVADNGRGFDTQAVPAGKGLGNFAERARELGGELSIDSQTGVGTRVRLTFSLIIL